MVLDSRLFQNTKQNSKLRKYDRHLYLESLAESISDSDEIWLEFDMIGKRLVKKMLKYYQNDTGKQEATMAVFAYEKDKTQGVSLYHVFKKPLDRRRDKLIWKNRR